ncbi:MAG: 5'-nucleotidase, lipoprotein e(P4) family [Planctomycetes bacterium]|nr:5'-nucleotidase, lipoprotein e(P4) family [Planctomycetota bacterium]
MLPRSARRSLPLLLLTGLLASLPAQAPAAHDQTLAVLWMQRSAEYEAACRQAFAAAARALVQACDDPHWTACLEQVDRDHYVDLPPAVIVDVDETLLDNTAFAARRIQAGGGFDAAAWAAWVRERQAGAIPGALGYVRTAVDLRVRVVYVTNRRADSSQPGQESTEESDTRANLLRLGFPIVEAEGEDVVLCAGEIGDKAARRRHVAQQFRIAQLVGDNLADFAPGMEPVRAGGSPPEPAAAQVERDRSRLVQDLASWWGERWILIPNPAYGSFEAVLRGQHADLRAALRTQR